MIVWNFTAQVRDNMLKEKLLYLHFPHPLSELKNLLRLLSCPTLQIFTNLKNNLVNNLEPLRKKNITLPQVGQAFVGMLEVCCKNPT
jgi:hypothetical protein